MITFPFLQDSYIFNCYIAKSKYKIKLKFKINYFILFYFKDYICIIKKLRWNISHFYIMFKL